MKLFRLMILNLREWFQTDSQRQLEEADAVILEFHPTGSIRKGMIEARLLLQVMPLNERNYVTEYCTYFDQKQLQEFYSGSKTKIYFRQNEPNKVRWLKDVSREPSIVSRQS